MSAASGEEHRRLRERIARSFDALLGRFPRLLPIQAQAIEPLADGHNVLLAAPTAGGKTEAALAPILHRILEAEGREVEGPALLYIVPTRALVNDVHRRLQAPMQRVGLVLGRKTGDHASLPKQFPQVLITTPESLDSMLTRIPRRLLPTQALVLDELHALDGTPRGDQLAALVSRLRRVLASRSGSRSRPLQVAMLSATIDRPEELAARYAEDCVLIKDAGAREMRARLSESPFGENPAAKLAALIEPEQGGKVLVFANSRADVEWGASKLRGLLPFGERVYAHHGSLAKSERERVERDFAHAKTACCFSTSTLELGIDIGDIDHVVLYGVPPDLPSFLQRVGRAGRRSGAVSFAALARDDGEKLRFKHMTQAAREGHLLTDPPVYDPGTALQQAASLLFQNPSHAIAPAHVLERLPSWQAEQWSEERLEIALEHADRHFKKIRAGHYTAGPELERAHRSGKLHGNIGGEAEVEVIEELTGRSLGTISITKRRQDQADDRLLLGGSARRMTRMRSDGRIVASKEEERAGGSSFYRARRTADSRGAGRGSAALDRARTGAHLPRRSRGRDDLRARARHAARRGPARRGE
jgi:ATP-dependent Lhr-like helicase